MNRIWRSIAVDARMDHVYGFLKDPYNLAEVWPNLEEVKGIRPSRVNGAYDFDLAFRMAHESLKARAKSIEARQYDRLKIKTEKGLDGTIGWKLAPIGGAATRVTVQFEYETPSHVAGRESPHKVVKENERGIDEMLQNLKQRVEAEVAYA